MRSAWFQRELLWKNRTNLKVMFLNSVPMDWKYEGKTIDQNLIIEWANVWYERSEYICPKFVIVDQKVQSDIRIDFKGNYTVFGPT